MKMLCPWSCGICVRSSEPAETAPVEPQVDTAATWTMATAGLDRIVGPESNGAVFSAEVCRKLIEAGEKTGFAMAVDSIDKNPAMDISVYNHHRVKAPRVHAILEPFLPLFKAELDRRYKGQDGVDNELDWVFFRKYRAGTIRSALLGHQDSNKHSINVALNTDFEGGGLYFVPPDSELGKIANGLSGASDEEARKLSAGMLPDHVPGPEHGNQSNYFFPHITPGVAMVYDNTVWHGVTPVLSGVRYTLSFFYDEPIDIKYQDDPHLLEEARAKEAKEAGEESANAKPPPPKPDEAEVPMKATLVDKRSKKASEVVGIFWLRNPPSLFATYSGGKVRVNLKRDGVFVGDGTEDAPEWNAPIEMDTYSSHWFGVVDMETLALVHAFHMTQKTTTYELTDEHTLFTPPPEYTSADSYSLQDGEYGDYYDDDDAPMSGPPTAGGSKAEPPAEPPVHDDL